MKTLFNYEEVKHEACNHYSTVTLSFDERQIAGIIEKEDFNRVKEYRNNLKNYLYLSQTGIREAYSKHFGRPLRIDQIKKIENEIKKLNEFLT